MPTVFLGAVITIESWATPPFCCNMTEGGVNVTVRPEEGENVPPSVTFPLKYPIDCRDIVVAILELWTRTSSVTGEERLKSRGSSVIVKTGVGVAV